MNTFRIPNLRWQIWTRLTAAVGVIAAAGALAQGAPGKPAADKAGPTYLRDIQPIFMGNCSRCHNQQSRFVYNWLDYKTAYADRWEIRRRVWDSWKGTYYKECMPVANSPESLALSDADRATIKQWVDDGSPCGVAPVAGAPETKADQLAAGHKLFMSICAACHQPTGLGRANMFPPLAASDYLNKSRDRAIQTVIFGRRGEVVVNGLKYNNTMPSFPLTDQNIADVLTYVYNSFGNSGITVSAEEVKTLRANPPAPAASTPEPKNEFE